MFYSYDLSGFGSKLKKIRKKIGIKQTDVYNKTGINVDTIRRIEGGTVIPKFQTLEILSAVYKTDLLKLLLTFRSNHYLYSFTQRLDKIIVDHDVSLIDELLHDYKISINDKQLTPLLINSQELEQFHIFLRSVREHFNDDAHNEMLLRDLIYALSLTINHYDLDKFSTYNYNFFEIRILLLISILLDKHSKTHLATNILLFAIEYLLESDQEGLDCQRLILNIYSNISYNYHMLDNNSLALTYAEAGIDYAIRRSTMDSLDLLYARKAVAELRLGYDNHLDSFRKSIHILEINKQYDLAELYKRITFEKYKIAL